MSASSMTIERELLDRAILIYIKHAYPNGSVPERVSKRLDALNQADVIRLDSPPFELTDEGSPDRSTHYALRLGNCQYPHMKLQVQHWQTAHGFLFSVNTHDQVQSPSPNSPAAEAFRALLAANQNVKFAIEAAWDEAGIPTFNRYLRNYIESGKRSL